MPIYFPAIYAHCSNSRHTAEATTTQKLQRISIHTIQKNKMSCVVNYFAFSKKHMRMALESDELSLSCGQRLNGHCHLSKIDGVQKDSYCAGQAYFKKGRLFKITNGSGTVRANGDLSKEDGIAHKDQVFECFSYFLGTSNMDGVEYHGYIDSRRKEIVKFVIV